MTFIEKDLEDILFEYSSSYEKRYLLQERGLPIMSHGTMLRQVDLAAYGIADLIDIYVGCKSDVFSSKFVQIDLYELKKEEVNWETFHQVVKYMRSIQLFIDQYYPKTRLYLNAFLIGKQLDKSGNFCFTSSVFNNINIYTYKYEIDGIKFYAESEYIISANVFNDRKILTRQFKQDLIDAFKESVAVGTQNKED